MQTVTTIEQAEKAGRNARAATMRIALVPTMGALHEGHLSLVRAAKAGCEFVVASIFVNPTQFAVGEDLAKYPRSLDRDRALLEGEGVDILFAPSVEEMYPSGGVTWVTVEGLSDRLDGRSRPGHFRGVTTVVAKLFHIVGPDVAFFGQKDAAQLAIIRRMVSDLNFPIEIIGVPIVRERDGLAMSSRNAYLDGSQRRRALALHRALLRIAKMHDQGERDAATLVASGKDEIASEPGIRLDFLEIVDRDTLEPVTNVSRGALVAVAAYLETTRLIDNILLPPEKNS